mgnify:CR=1 FL=1
MLSSCVITTDTTYSDPNYLKSSEFKTYEEKIKTVKIDKESYEYDSIKEDDSGNNNDFTANNMGTDHQVIDTPTFTAP